MWMLALASCHDPDAMGARVGAFHDSAACGGEDTDSDGVADLCDVCPDADDGADLDSDGVADGCDACPGADDAGPDLDSDGVADACDRCPGADDGADLDSDGVPDGCDVCPGSDTSDLDSDGLPDGCDVCDDHRADPGVASNVMLVVLDDVGVDDIGVYSGFRRTSTPTLDRLARNGRWYNNAWGYPVCGPARAAIQTGRHARRTGYGENVYGRDYELDEAQTTIAEVVHLADPAWTTSFLGKWHLDSDALGRRTALREPHAQGWDWFAGTRANLDTWLLGAKVPTHGTYFDWNKVRDNGTEVVRHRYATTEIADDAIGQMAVLPEPWLLTVAFHAAHGPYHYPPRRLTPSGREPGVPGMYKAMLEAADTELGRVLDAMDPALRRRTLVIVVGDNGDLFEDGHLTQEGKGNLTDEGVRVPFLVSGPGVRGCGQPSYGLVSIVDLLPTVAELAGVDVATLPGVLDPSQPLALDGVSLLPSLADPAAPIHDLLYAGVLEPAGPGPYTSAREGLRTREWKYTLDDRGVERFYRYPHPWSEENELDLGSLNATQRDALRDLRDQLRAVRATPYDAAQ